MVSIFHIMTKRKNPFDDFHFLQKIHVGVKEVNLGVNHVENMKKVYENTMKMLFNQAMVNQNDFLKLQNGISPSEKVCPLLQNGVPDANSKCVNNMLQPVIPNKQERSVLMNSCCMASVQKQCSFCEKIMCAVCQRVCQNCNNEFCQLCSILQYDSQEETAICLSCM